MYLKSCVADFTRPACANYREIIASNLLFLIILFNCCQNVARAGSGAVQVQFSAFDREHLLTVALLQQNLLLIWRRRDRQAAK